MFYLLYQLPVYLVSQLVDPRLILDHLELPLNTLLAGLILHLLRSLLYIQVLLCLLDHLYFQVQREIEELLLVVLEEHVGVHLFDQTVFLAEELGVELGLDCVHLCRELLQLDLYDTLSLTLLVL